MHYLLFYHVVDHYVEQRVAFRTAHLEHAWRAHECPASAFTAL